MLTKLDRIIQEVRDDLPALRGRLAEVRRAADAAAVPPEWAAAFRTADVSVIAEVKRRSPSAGPIAEDLDPVRHARQYAAGGAAAVSVLTEARHFGGSLSDLERVSHAVAVPVLRKDFVLDPVQLYEARAAGASAVLLIVRALEPDTLKDLVQLARELRLGTLVEVHGGNELDVALSAEPESIGVNSRDLSDFSVDIRRLEGVLREIPSDVIAVAESGLRTRVDVERAARWGADAVLVGTALTAAADTRAAVRALVGVERRGRG